MLHEAIWVDDRTVACNVGRDRFDFDVALERSISHSVFHIQKNVEMRVRHVLAFVVTDECIACALS